MDILTVDFETFYDKDYSLSKMQTDAYINDDRFEVIGVAVIKNDEDAVWSVAQSWRSQGGCIDTTGPTALCAATTLCSMGTS